MSYIAVIVAIVSLVVSVLRHNEVTKLQRESELRHILTQNCLTILKLMRDNHTTVNHDPSTRKTNYFDDVFGNIHDNITLTCVLNFNHNEWDQLKNDWGDFAKDPGCLGPIYLKTHDVIMKTLSTINKRG